MWGADCPVAREMPLPYHVAPRHRSPGARQRDPHKRGGILRKKRTRFGHRFRQRAPSPATRGGYVRGAGPGRRRKSLTRSGAGLEAPRWAVAFNHEQKRRRPRALVASGGRACPALPGAPAPAHRHRLTWSARGSGPASVRWRRSGRGCNPRPTSFSFHADCGHRAGHKRCREQPLWMAPPPRTPIPKDPSRVARRAGRA